MPCKAETDAEMLDHANGRVHALTDMLCRTCELATALPPDVADWYREHLRWDARRREVEELTRQHLERARLEEEARERLVASARSKAMVAGLTAEELRAIGL